MKRSKIFLGVTTCLLAIAGVAATKAYSPRTISKAFYYTSAALNHCYQITHELFCTKPGTGCVTQLPNGSGGFAPYQLYLSKATVGGVANTCKTPIQVTEE